MATFAINPVNRFEGSSATIRRPKEFTYFSFDQNRNFHPRSDRSLKYYYPPFIDSPGESGQAKPRPNLSNGFDTFRQHDDKVDEHLDALLETIMQHEKSNGQMVHSDIVAWRGLITKIMTAPFDVFNEFSLNATCFNGTIFIEENWTGKPANDDRQTRGPQAMMQYWGYKFEAMSVLNKPWAEATREEIENRDNDIVDNEEQYCSIVTTGIGNTSMIIGGEVDAVLGQKPDDPNVPIPWIELKTSELPTNPKADLKFERKLQKFWAQSFLLGVPKIIVGFRSPDGFLLKLQEFETQKLPSTVKKQGQRTWDGNICINFAAAFLDYIKTKVTGDGVWRIEHQKNDGSIYVYPVTHLDPQRIVSPAFRAHRESMKAKGVAIALGRPRNSAGE